MAAPPLILASASPEFYVAELGRELGFDLTLGTPVELGSFFPDLVNHKGSAKVEATLGFLLMVIRSSVEDEIQRYLDDEFGPA